MDESPRKVEIFAPFSAAIDLTKLILFQPFDLAKWCVVGFAAFLAQLGSGGNFNPGSGWSGGRGDWDWKFRSISNEATETASALPGWVLPLIVFGGCLFLVLVVVLLWVGSRGKFIFIDCVVRNRGAILEPWREFRKEGNSLFVFSLLVGSAILAVLCVASLPVLLPWIRNHDSVGGPGFIAGLIVFGVVAACVGVAWAVISTFMVPVMYRRRCRAVEGFRGALALVLAQPGPVILYVLFKVVLWIAFAMVACLATCLTCCLAAIPYVGTVILLPAHVLFMSFLLLFVRQFGLEYDVWANVPAAAPTAAPTQSRPPELPPVQ